MCGRTACTLAPGEICKACSYKASDGKFRQAEWRDSTSSFDYKPSYNVGPTRATPVLVLKKYFDKSAGPQERVLTPMVWGLIPPYHKGEYNKHGLSTNNCRSEGVRNSHLYSGPLKRGQRCVVLCDGFYEWHREKGGQKQPYLIYMKQPDNVKIEDRSSWKLEWSEDDGYSGPRLVPIAGLFGEWTSDQGEHVLSYTVMTMSPSKELEWMHDRMPVILDSEDKIQAWLESEKVEGALQVVTPSSELVWHPVISSVGNVRNDSVQNVQPIDIKKAGSVKKESGSSMFMSNWLKKSPAKSLVKEDPSKSPKPEEKSPGTSPKSEGKMSPFPSSAGKTKARRSLSPSVLESVSKRTRGSSSIKKE